MSTQFTNSVSYLRHNHWLEAESLGYVNEVLYGASFMGIIPIVPTSHFMRDEYMARNQQAEKLTQKRKLNEEPPAKSGNPFSKRVEHTALYDRRTDLEIILAEENPGTYDAMLMADAEELVQDIDYDIINGVPDNDGYGLQGLESRIAIGSEMDVNNNTALTINTSGATMKSFLKLFRKAVDKVKLSPGMRLVAFCNEEVEQAISAGRDELGANVVGVSVGDIFNQRVTMIDNVPLVKVRTDSIGTEILPFDENSESSTSIWICGIGGAPGEGSKKLPNGLVILSNQQVIRTRTEQTLTQFRTLQEIDVGLRVPKRSVCRISRLKVA